MDAVVLKSDAPLAGDQTQAHPRPLRVGVVCDFREERWHSMDLVADMLLENLAGNDGVTATKLQPPLLRRLSRIPVLPQKPAWNADRLLNRFADYPRWLGRRRGDYDLFHLVDHSYSQLIPVLRGRPSVVTCHDLDTFRCLVTPEREPRPRWFRVMTKRILDGFVRADHVIAVSAATRDDLLHYGFVAPEKITVIPNGVHPSCSPLPDPGADEAFNRLLPKTSGETVWLLNVGSALPRKRLDLLLRVFAAIRRDVKQARLIRVGEKFTEPHLRLMKELGVESDIVFIPFLERDALAAAYRRATLLLHTAEAEGFGLPVIEAMACGCPAVASDIPVLREVGGDAAEYCKVGDVEAWRDTVTRLVENISRLDTLRERRRASIEHAQRFSWTENARQVANVYRRVLKLQ